MYARASCSLTDLSGLIQLAGHLAARERGAVGEAEDPVRVGARVRVRSDVAGARLVPVRGVEREVRLGEGCPAHIRAKDHARVTATATGHCHCHGHGHAPMDYYIHSNRNTKHTIQHATLSGTKRPS